MDSTSKHAKFKVIDFSTFRVMTSQSYPSQKGTTHRDLIFTPWNRPKFEKITSDPKLYSPMHFPGFQAKQKAHMFNFFRHLIYKTTAAIPLVNRFSLNSAKICLIDKKYKSQRLDVLG